MTVRFTITPQLAAAIVFFALGLAVWLFGAIKPLSTQAFTISNK